MIACSKLLLLRLTRRCRRWMSILILMLAGSHACAQAPAEAARDDAAVWSQWINDTTFVVATIDTKRLELAELADTFAGQTIWLVMDIPSSASQPLLRLWIKREPANDPEDRTAKFWDLYFGEPESEGKFLRYSLYIPSAETHFPTATVVAATAERPYLQDALAATADAPLQCIIIPPEYLRTTVRDLMPELPSRLGGGSTSVLAEGLLWASLTMAPDSSGAKVKIQSASQAAANRLAEQLPVLIAHLMGALPQLQQFSPAPGAIQPEVDDDQVVLEIGAERTAAVWQVVVQRTLQHVMSLRTQQQLKRIALAIHNFESTHRQFPPPADSREEQGKPLLSWRVHLLPYLGEMELYARFRLDEPWDSAHNLLLVEKIPTIFVSPSARKGHTRLLAPVGENTIFGGSKPVRFQDITDGTVNTAMVVAVQPERAVPWTAPEDYAFDPADPGAGLARDAAGYFLMAAADGSVHQVPSDRPAQTLLNLFQISDGNVVQW